MNKRYWITLTIALILLAALLLSACSKPAATTTTQAPTATSTAPITTTKAPTTTSAAPVTTTSAPTQTPVAKKGGTLKIGVPAEATALGRPDVGQPGVDGYLDGTCHRDVKNT